MSICPSTPLILQLLDREQTPGDLEEHLANCPLCQKALLDAAGPLSLPTPRPTGDDPPQALLERSRVLLAQEQGDTQELPLPDLPGIEILEEIERGGEGVVYKARQIRLDRIIALKVLHAARVRSVEGFERARRGVQCLARCSHPNIVQVHDVGVHQGLFYGILEYIEGGSLARQLDGHPWPPAAAARLTVELAEAVHFIHERGLVHRDLKTANVLLGRDGRARIADFGLARSLEDATALTGSGIVVGTPGAMAPEQIEGTSSPTVSVDIHALGVILYELLTGRRPYRGDSLQEVLDRTTQDAPAPPRQLVAGVPARLEAICLRCLRKDPRGRYLSARALARDLREFLAGPGQKSRKMGTWTLGGCVVLLAVSLGLTWQWHQSEKSLDQAEEALYRLRLETARRYLELNDRAGAWSLLERCRPEPGQRDRRDDDWRELWQRSQPREEP